MAAALALFLVSNSAVVVVAGGMATVTPSDSGSVVPNDGPDYGVNNSTFQRLWSEDADNGNLSADDFDDANVSSRAEFAHRLARSTDIRSISHHRLLGTGTMEISVITVLVTEIRPSILKVHPSKTVCT